MLQRRPEDDYTQEKLGLVSGQLQRIQAINRYIQYMQYAQMFGIQNPLQDQNFGPMLQQDANRLNSTDTMGQEVIDLMIDDRLVRQEAKRRGITVSAAELDKALQESFQYYPNGTPTVAPTATEIVMPTLNPTELAIVTITPTPSPAPTATEPATPTLDPSATIAPTATVEPTATTGPTATSEPTATPITAAGYASLLKERMDGIKTETGLDEAAYRTLVEGNLLRQKLEDDVTKDVTPMQDQVWARHILVADEATAKAVRQRLVNGEDFAKVAAQVSTDTGTKDKGGDLGWFGKGKMVPEFETAAFGLKVGEISQPIKSQYGYHIIQVLAHANVPLDASAYDQAKQTAFDNWLTKLRDEYKVVTYNNWQNAVPTDPAAPASPQ